MPDTRIFVPRLTRPEAGNKYYITKSRGGYSDAVPGKPTDRLCNVLANCVGYAYGRFNEIGDYGECRYLWPSNAERFIENRGNLAVGQEPRLGACMVWQKGATLSGGDGAGHVAIVEKVISPTEVITSESGWNSSPFWTKNRQKGNGNWGAGASYRFRGFIYNPAVSPDAITLGQTDEYKNNDILSASSVTFADLGIDESKVAPFIATIDPSMIDINYDTLKQMKVSGMMFFAGQKYTDDSHIARNIFRATNLRAQIESCQSAGLPFALYTKVLARNNTEALEELRQLYYTISRYPPGLGLWLALKFKNEITTNNLILDTYYNKLKEYGLMDGCGLYVTEDELAQITWDDYKDKFQLWLIKYCDTEEDANSIDIRVEPEFFKLVSDETTEGDEN